MFQSLLTACLAQSVHSQKFGVIIQGVKAMSVYLRMNKKGFAKFNPRCIGPKPRFRIRKKSCDCPICGARVAGAVPNTVLSKRWKRLCRTFTHLPVELDSDCESDFAHLPGDEESDCASVSSFAPTASTASSASPAPADEPPPPPPPPPAGVFVFPANFSGNIVIDQSVHYTFSFAQR